MERVSERYQQVRSKFRKLEDAFRRFINKNITEEELVEICEKYARILVGSPVKVFIISSKTPKIFVRSVLNPNFTFALKGIYISRSLILQIPPEQTVAAFLHQCFMYKVAVNNPRITSYYWLVHFPVYFLSIGGMVGAKLFSYIVTFLSKDETSNKHVTRFKLYAILLIIFSLATKSIFYYNVYTQEFLADSFATRFGYGPEIARFFEWYREEDELYGANIPVVKSARKVMDTLKTAIRVFLELPGYNTRTCMIAKQILKEAQSNRILDRRQIKWAKIALQECSSTTKKTSVRKQREKILKIMDQVERDFKNAKI